MGVKDVQEEETEMSVANKIIESLRDERSLTARFTVDVVVADNKRAKKTITANSVESEDFARLVTMFDLLIGERADDAAITACAKTLARGDAVKEERVLTALRKSYWQLTLDLEHGVGDDE